MARTEALRTAGKGIVVLVSNDNYTTDFSKGGGTTMTPLERVQMSCRLPQGAESCHPFKVSPLARRPMTEEDVHLKPENDTALMTRTIPKLEVAQWYAIAPKLPND